MSWFRSNQGRVAWLALFALACQLVLAFGHVHLGKVGGFSESGAVAADDGVYFASLTSPQHNEPTGLCDDFCAICASISLANTLFIPASPAVAPPIAITRNLLWSLAAVELASIDHLFFDARGPPNV
jgi:hypothetical protein